MESAVTIAVQIGRPNIRQPFTVPVTRGRYTHVPGIAVASVAMLAFALLFATEPWSPASNPLVTLPLFVATAGLIVAADLMLRPKPPFARFRDTGVMQAALLAVVVTLMFSVLTDELLAWPILYPAFILPIAMPVAGLLGLAPTSRLSLTDAQRSRAILIGLVAGTLLLLAVAPAYQGQIAAQWLR